MLSRITSLFCALLVLAAQDPEAIFRSDIRLVLLHATVVDKNGSLITNLGRDAFAVFENNIAQQLKVFRREDVPVSLGLVVDNSGSMRDKRKKVESAALALVKASNPEDEVFIVNFNDDAWLDVEFTRDIKVMEEGITKIDSRGGTAMRDAVSMSIDYLKKEGKKDKKILLIITDGNDNTSTMTLERLVGKVQQAEILVYSIGLLSEEERGEARKAKRSLDAITHASGGQPYYPKEAEEVDKMSLQVAHEIRSQYVLAYTPSEQALDGTFRQIRVTVKGPNRPIARTRTGYYATRDRALPKTPALSPVKPTSANSVRP
ncbi:MAG: VWA domain-containing protein [Bryobacteraceae bacterium]